MARGKATFDTMPTVDVESNLRVSPTVDVSNRVNPDMRRMNPARSLDGELDDLASSLELDPVQMRAHEKEAVRGGYGDYKHIPKKSLDDEMMVFKGESFLDDVEKKGASKSLLKLVKERAPRANLTTLRTRGNLRKDLREVMRGTKGRAESIHPEAEGHYRIKELSSSMLVTKGIKNLPAETQKIVDDILSPETARKIEQARVQDKAGMAALNSRVDSALAKGREAVATKPKIGAGKIAAATALGMGLPVAGYLAYRHLKNKKEFDGNIVVKEQETVPVGLAIRDLRRLDRMTNYLKKRGQQYETYEEEPTPEDQVQPKELSDGVVVEKGVARTVVSGIGGGALGGTLAGLSAANYSKDKDRKTNAREAVARGALLGGLLGVGFNKNAAAAAATSGLAGVGVGAERVLMNDRKIKQTGLVRETKGVGEEFLVFKGPQFAHRVKQTVTSRQHMKDLMKKKGFEEDLEVKFAKKLVQGAKDVLNKVIKPKPVPVAPRTAGTNVFRNSTKPAADFHVDPKGTATASAPPKTAPTGKPPTTQANQKKPDTGPGTAAGTDYQGPPVTTGQVKGKKRVDPTNPPRKPLSPYSKAALTVGGSGVAGAGIYAAATREPEYIPPAMGYQEYKGDIQQKAFKCVMRPESRPDLHAALAKIGKLKTRS